MFDFLKGGKATIRVDLDQESQVFYHGDTISGRVELVGQKDLKIQSARLALAYKEEYQYRHREVDSKGKRSVVTSWTTEEHEVQRQALLEAGTVAGGVTQTFPFSFTIPGGTPPTLQGGRILRVHWQVKATLDRKLAGDVEDRVDILIHSFPNQAPQPGMYGASNEPDEAGLSLQLPGKEFALGEAILGELYVRPQKDFDVSAVRVELECSEWVAREEGNSSAQSWNLPIAGKTQFLGGQDCSFPFRIEVPNPAPVSASSPAGRISWKIKAVLDRTLRGDTRLEEPVMIFSARR